MKLFTLFLTCCLLIPAFAQSTMNADEIIAKINAGEAVSLSNATITGNLDFSKLDNKSRVEMKNYKYYVAVPVSFTNCTFQGDVLAYYHDDYEEITHSADFEKDAVFAGCIFEQLAEFKYSSFEGESDFTGTIFRWDANFKYAEFRHEAQFEKTKIGGEGNFKYAEFNKKAQFKGAMFDEEGNFKYAEFDDFADFADTEMEDANFKYVELDYGGSFANAVIHSDADFKYADFSSPLNFDKVDIRGSADFKYTEIDGDDFTMFLLKRN